ELLAIGALGLLATAGIVVYELRNTQIYDYAVRRAAELERRLGIVSVVDPDGRAGLFGDRPPAGLRLFGVGLGPQGRGLAPVYGAAIAGWVYVVVWGALRALDVGGAQKIGGLAGAVAGIGVLVELVRFGGRDVAAAPAR